MDPQKDGVVGLVSNTMHGGWIYELHKQYQLFFENIHTELVVAVEIWQIMQASLIYGSRLRRR